MKTKLTITASVLLLSMFSIACGGESEISLEDYFQQVEAILIESDQEEAALEGRFPGAFEEGPATADFFNAVVDVRREANARLADIDPPAEAKGAHEQLIFDTNHLLEVASNFADLVQAAQTTSDLEAIFEAETPALDAAQTRMEDACGALQAIADRSAIDVDLGGEQRECESDVRASELAPVNETPVPNLPRRTPPPELRVAGNQILNAFDEVVVLRGVALSDPAFPSFRGPYSAIDFAALVEEWGVSIIRVPIHPPPWARDPQRYLATYLDPLVQLGAEYGIYVFLGWHAHGNPITGEVEQPDSGPVPNHLNPYNPDLSLAKSALTAMAQRYKDKPWVLYGTFNEPSHITWRAWRPVAEQLVDVIHAVNPKAVVFVSGVDWGYDLSGALRNPVERDNIIYETHPYPGKGEDWKLTLDQLRQTSAVFIGEWGFTPNSSSSNLRGTTSEYGLPLVQYAEARNIGWTAWWWNPSGEVTMLDSWQNYKPTEFGQLVKDSLTKG